MQKNMGSVDRIVRVIAALAVGVLFFIGEISGLAAIVLGILAAVFLMTSAMGSCPLYIPLKLNTIGKEKQK
ncbi:MAG: DUF2892 domain-containing protein [Ignavibacteriales bacterium]|nr:DUF2892 domain-containing protein [Ignavibacteriales bacterium]